MPRNIWPVCNLLRLPDELLVDIAQRLLVFRKPNNRPLLIDSTQFHKLPANALAITLTDKRLRNICNQVFYGLNTFYLVPEQRTAFDGILLGHVQGTGQPVDWVCHNLLPTHPTQVTRDVRATIMCYGFPKKATYITEGTVLELPPNRFRKLIKYLTLAVTVPEEYGLVGWSCNKTGAMMLYEPGLLRPKYEQANVDWLGPIRDFDLLGFSNLNLEEFRSSIIVEYQTYGQTGLPNSLKKYAKAQVKTWVDEALAGMSGEAVERLGFYVDPTIAD